MSDQSHMAGSSNAHGAELGSLCTVGVDGFEVQADIGVHPHEHDRRQLLIVSVSLDVRPPTSDIIIDAFDYAEIPAIIEIVAARHTNLIETFSADIARLCLAHPLVWRADVRVRKPSALTNGTAWACVTLIKAVRKGGCSAAWTADESLVPPFNGMNPQ